MTRQTTVPATTLPRARRYRMLHLAAIVLPLVAACASMPRAGARAADGDVLRISTEGHAGAARVVVSGARVSLLTGGRAARHDTLFAVAPFALALPADAFELQVVVTDPRGREADADFELNVPDAAGSERVRATGARLLLRRAAPGSAIEVVGAKRPVEVQRVPRIG